jgi:hypothetical protein
MKYTFLYITTILCANQHSDIKSGFFIVTDRKLKDLVMKNRTYTNLIKLTDDKGILGLDFFWDRYFPKPFMYGFNCERLINSKIPVSLDLEGITHDNEVLFGFTISFDLKSIELFNFTDANSVHVTNSQYNKDLTFFNIFMISREAKNVKSIRASFEYIKNTYKIMPFYKEIFRILFLYIKNIGDLAKSVEDNEKVFNEASDAKHYMILKTIDILQSLSELRIPFFLKLDNLHTKESFKNVLYSIFKMLEVVIEEHLKKLHNGDIVYERSDITDKINNDIIQNTLPRLIETYNELYTRLKSLDEFSRSVSQEGNGNKDLELLSNCNLAKTDKFAENFFHQLKVYCVIMHNCNFIDVFNHYFPTELSEIDLSVKKLVEFYADKEFANILLSYIVDYIKGDKTDFLFFSQTEYFKRILSSRILNNLRLLREVNLPPSESATRKKFSEFVIKRKKDVCDHIANAEKNWRFLLKDDISGFYKSFAELF